MDALQRSLTLAELEREIETIDLQRARVVAMRDAAGAGGWSSVGDLVLGDGAGAAVRAVYSERLAALDQELAQLHRCRLDLVLGELAEVERDAVVF